MRRARGLGPRILAVALVLGASACASFGEERRAEARLREASLNAAEVLARESGPAWRSLGDERFEALAVAEMRRGEVGGPAPAFRNLRTVPYGEGALVCGDLRFAGAAPPEPWRPFMGGALPGVVWSEFSRGWITRAANAGIASACG